jgi:hypothetical protein
VINIVEHPHSAVVMSVRARTKTQVPASTPIASFPIGCALPSGEMTRQQDAASRLNVDPNALKPIGWLNEAHYVQLYKKNALEENFARQIEAFRAETAKTPGL